MHVELPQHSLLPPVLHRQAVVGIVGWLTVEDLVEFLALIHTGKGFKLGGLEFGETFFPEEEDRVYEELALFS